MALAVAHRCAAGAERRPELAAGCQEAACLVALAVAAVLGREVAYRVASGGVREEVRPASLGELQPAACLGALEQWTAWLHHPLRVVELQGADHQSAVVVEEELRLQKAAWQASTRTRT